MDLYILDVNMRRVDVFDAYKSLIWTERLLPPCEFELETVHNQQAQAIFQKGRFLWIQGSDRVMVVETTTVVHDDDERILRVLGRSVEKWLDDRVAAQSLGPTVDAAGNDVLWKFTATPAQAMRDIVRKGLTLKTSDSNSYIAPIIDSTTGSIPETAATEFQIRPGPVLPMLSEIGEVYRLGWKLARTGDIGQMNFQVFTGDDRTTTQTINSPVVFGEELGNLTNIGTLESIKEYKNVAYVFSKKVSIEVFADGVDPSISGAEKRVLFVDATDIPDKDENDVPLTIAAITEILQRRGKNELAKYNPIMAFDGEADKNSGYVYNVDYKLGDRVEFRDAFGNRNVMIVSEQIFVVDAEGSKAYPTLTFHDMTIAGSWDAYNPTQMWDDVPNDFDHEWLDLP